MTWSYSGDPGDSNRDHVRFLLGDTDSSDEQLQNEEIAFLLTDNNDSVYDAAAKGARALAAKYARRINRAVGDLKIQFSDLQKHYTAMAAKLERQASARGIDVMAGGVFKSTDEADRADTSINQPRFKSGQFVNPNTGGTSEYDEDWS